MAQNWAKKFRNLGITLILWPINIHQIVPFQFVNKCPIHFITIGYNNLREASLNCMLYYLSQMITLPVCMNLSALRGLNGMLYYLSLGLSQDNNVASL